jgi:hypothetical protein
VIRYLIEYRPPILNGKTEFRAADGSFCTCALHAERHLTRGAAYAKVHELQAHGNPSADSLHVAEHHWDE